MLMVRVTVDGVLILGNIYRFRTVPFWKFIGSLTQHPIIAYVLQCQQKVLIVVTLIFCCF